MKKYLLDSLAVIRSRPEFVFIDEERIKAVARDLAGENLSVPDWRLENVLPSSDDELFIQYLGVVTAVNFAFTNFEAPHSKFEIFWQGRSFHGSIALGACFMRALVEGYPILNGEYLKSIETEDIEHLFRGYSPIPLMGERLKILRHVGENLLKHYDGHFVNLFKKADFRAFAGSKPGDLGVVERLFVHFPLAFCDVWHHAKSPSLLRFHKKAQLCAMIYHGRALSSRGRLEPLKDADNLGPPADYAVPAVLKSMGVLSYCPALEEKIRQRRIIKPGSSEELEIRAQTVAAMLKLRDEINNHRKEKINTLILDSRIWSARNGLSEPHHLTPTTCY